MPVEFFSGLFLELFSRRLHTVNFISRLSLSIIVFVPVSELG